MTAQAGELQQAWDQADDATLLEFARAGDAAAYGELWRRHLPAAYGVAYRYRNRASAEDIVAEAAARVYALIKAGKGPQTNFRSYFLTTVRTAATDTARSDLRVVPTEGADLEVMAGATEAHDPTKSVDHEMVRAAFQALPERDQRVLWFTTVEGESPSKVAATMGMSANGVSVTALRAKDTLRARYLDAHATRAISRAEDDECRWVLSNMGRFVRGKLPSRQKARVEEHLRSCRHAQGLAYEMADVSRGLPALIVPLIFMSSIAAKAAWVAVPAILAAAGPDPSSAAAGQQAAAAQPTGTPASPTGGEAATSAALGAAAGGGTGAVTSVFAVAGSGATMVGLAVAAAAGLVVLAVTQLPKVLGNDAPPQSRPVLAVPTATSSSATSSPGPTSPSPSALPPTASPTVVAPVFTPPAPVQPKPQPRPTSPAHTTSPSPTTVPTSTTTTTTPSSTTTTTAPVIVEPTWTVLPDAEGAGLYTVAVDPGTFSGTLAVTVHSTAGPVLGSGIGWTCVSTPGATDTTTCSATVAATGVPGAAALGAGKSPADLTLTASDRRAGQIDLDATLGDWAAARETFVRDVVPPTIEIVQGASSTGLPVFEVRVDLGLSTAPEFSVKVGTLWGNLDQVFGGPGWACSPVKDPALGANVESCVPESVSRKLAPLLITVTKAGVRHFVAEVVTDAGAVSTSLDWNG